MTMTQCPLCLAPVARVTAKSAECGVLISDATPFSTHLKKLAELPRQPACAFYLASARSALFPIAPRSQHTTTVTTGLQPHLSLLKQKLGRSHGFTNKPYVTTA